MYGHIIIRRGDFQRIIKTNDHDTIYEVMRSLGSDHQEAADIAGWAPEAIIGEEYWPGDTTITIYVDD